MAKPKRDEERDERIIMEIVVDAYDEVERAMGWHCHLDDRLSPFKARCIERRATSPLEVGDEVNVLGMADADDCEHEMHVRIEWQSKRELAVPLSQLKPLDADEETQQAVEDRHYWVRMGYGF